MMGLLELSGVIMPTQENDTQGRKSLLKIEDTIINVLEVLYTKRPT